MRTNKKGICLYFKIFFILFLFGVLLPYLFNILVSNIFFIKDELLEGNSTFVMINVNRQKSIFSIIFKLLYKILIFDI
ncbi:hypothetical protein Q428_13315 [Fervidicella metallireducens AeB]|uniref:Uncharacterized protein n=1 Tax=Fervidicella metallireducens AeB TaxID=1403537 RepID=A0A017RS28_9CLOT|nr:hypothetical protein Q428_13315 [Fervidicella metallireducens AeB]